jgi:hypothetical protein
MRHGDGAPVIASHPTEPSAVPLPAQPPPVPAAPHEDPPAPTAAPTAAPTPSAPSAPPATDDPSARRDPVLDPPAAPAPGEPAAPDPGRVEPRAPSGSGAPRTAPRPHAPASGSREPVPHAQGSGGTIDVAVDSAPAGAQVVLDGAVLGTTPYRGTLTRRDRDIKLVLRLAGYADRIVLARESQPISERVLLVRKAAPPAAKSPRTDHDRSVNPF